MSDTPYAKRALRGVEAYVPGEQPPPDPALIKLNTNENPYPPGPRVEAALRAFELDALRRYPDPRQSALRAAAADLLGVPADWVVGGNGSDELLALVLRAFVNPGDTVAYPVPTYSLYRSLAGMYEARVVERPAAPGAPKVDAVIGVPAAVTFIASPNSPDGYPVPPGEIDRLCAARRGEGVVVVDEAYVDFSEVGCLELLRKRENLILTRTLSKSFCLAGLRLGLAVAGPPLMATLWKVKDIYNLGGLSQRLATAALEDAAYMRACAAKIVATRETTARALAERGWTVYPSQANFLFAEPPGGNGRELYRALAERKIFVRYFAEPSLDKGLRISIGSDEQMRRFLAALDEIWAA